MSIALSIRELALRATVAALGVTGTPAATVSRSRLDQFEQDELPLYDVTPGEEKVEDPGEFGDRETVTRTMVVMVRAIVDAATQENEPADVNAVNVPRVDDSALDPFYVFAVQQLIGSGSNLGGVVLQIDETSAATVFQPAGRDVIGLEMTFEVKFATKRGDPAQKE